MIGVSYNLQRIVTVNAPVTPTFTAPATMASINTLGGSGTFSFQFNSNKRTCTTNVAGSVSGSGASSFTYFGASDLVDPSDYEVMVTLGSNSGNSDITTAGGSATLGVWISLSSSPLYSFSCSDRRGGNRPITVAIRHKVNTGVTASTSITMNQSSDAVDPTFSSVGGSLTLTRTTANSYLGIYINSASSANAGRFRTYKETTIDSDIGFTFSTGSIPESEYEYIASSLTVTPSGSLSFSGGSYVDISTARASAPSNSGGGALYFANNVMPAGVGVMRFTIRHKLDQAKSEFFDKTFQTF
jgi:hypothetical protein